MVDSIVYDMSDFFRQSVDTYKKLSKTDYLRKVTTPFVPETVDDSRMIQKLSAAAARIMQHGGESGGPSSAELDDEEDLFVAAIAELNKYFHGVACAAKAFNKTKLPTELTLKTTTMPMTEPTSSYKEDCNRLLHASS